MTQTVPVPYAIRHLIQSNNQLLKQYQAELTAKVLEANEEMMKLLNLNPDDGWRLDMDTMSYVKIDTDDTSVSE
jgi:hypothetical protein